MRNLRVAVESCSHGLSYHKDLLTITYWEQLEQRKPNHGAPAVLPRQGRDLHLPHALGEYGQQYERPGNKVRIVFILLG